MGFPASVLRFIGDSVVHTLPQGDSRKKKRNFCTDCSSIDFGGERGETEQHTVYAGSLDDPAHFKPTIAIFNSQRPPWAPLPAGLTVFERMPS